MAGITENRPGGAHVERPRIETLGAAAGEIARLFIVFDKTAVDVTPGYLETQMAGEKGVTWDTFRGWPNRRIPFIAPISRRQGRIELGAAVTWMNGIQAPYRLQQTPLLLPGEDGKFAKTDAITLRESGQGFYPGQEYVVTGERILKADYIHHGSAPTVGSHGGLAWSTPRDYIGDTYQEMTALHPDLTKLITHVQSYETV